MAAGKGSQGVGVWREWCMGELADGPGYFAHLVEVCAHEEVEYTWFKPRPGRGPPQEQRTGPFMSGINTTNIRFPILSSEGKFFLILIG